MRGSVRPGSAVAPEAEAIATRLSTQHKIQTAGREPVVCHKLRCMTGFPLLVVQCQAPLALQFACILILAAAKASSATPSSKSLADLFFLAARFYAIPLFVCPG